MCHIKRRLEAQGGIFRKAAAWLGVLLSLACAPALATNWDGVGAANNNWSQGANWVGNAAPANPSGVVSFAAAGAPLASTVDVPWTLSQLSFLNFNWAVTGQTITFANPGFLDVTGGAPTITNPIVIGGTATITNSVPITLSSVTGFPSRSLIKAGAGTLTVSTFGLNGTTTINAGTLVASPANGSGASDVVVAAGATLNSTVGFWRSLSGAGTAVLVDGAFFNQSSTTTFSGNIQGSGGLNKSGPGTLILTGNNSLNNQLTLSGPIQFGDGVRAGTTPFPDNGWVNGGPGTGAVVTMNLTGSANVRCMVNAASVVVVSGTVNQTGTQVTGCPWNTSGDHTVNGGNLQNTEVLSNGNFVINFPGTWRASSGFAGSLAGNGTVIFNGEVAIGGNGSDTTYSGSLSGTGSLRKQGNGKLTLSGVVNLPNASSVDAGTVHLQNAQIIPYLVVSGGATLSGSGVTFNPIEVLGGATLAPTLIDTYSVYSAGNLAFAINGTAPGSQHSRINVSAAPNLNGSTLVLSGSYVAGPADSFVLINNNDPSNFAANGTFSGLPEGAVTMFNGVPLKITYAGGSNNNDVVLSYASHTVTSSSSGNGGISPNGAQTLNHNATTSFTLAPAPNYHIGSVTGTCGGSLVGNTFTTSAVTGNCTVIANFAIDTYLVTPSAGANGTISPPTAQSVAHGSTQAFTVTPSTGYDAAVGGTCPAGTLVGTTYTTGAITAACTVAATFTLKQYTVTPSAGANGTISPATAQTVNHGSTLQFTVTPNANYTATVGGSCPAGSLVGNTYTTGAITAHCTVSATFALNNYTVTPSAAANGTISPNAPQSVVHGSTLQFTVTPGTGYTASVGGTCAAGSLVGTTYTTGAITGICTVAATFALTTYTVTPSAGANGTISPATPQAVSHGATQQFTVTPNTGYDAAMGGTCPAGSLVGSTYTTGAITGSCTVSASFTLKSYTVTAIPGANGTISPATRTVSHGSTTTFTVTPDANHTAAASGCGGTLAGNTYTTGATTGDCTVSATFSATLATYNIVLEGWQVVGPYVITPAAGGGTAVFNPVTRQLAFNLTFSGLSGSESGASVYGPAARGANGATIAALATGSPKTDVITLDAAQAAMLLAGELSVGIRTPLHPNGEIRGQIDNLGATPLRTLSVAKSGNGGGLVFGGNLAGQAIDCGADCTELVPHGQTVTLLPSASTFSTFTGWTGCDSVSGEQCTVTMTANRTVTGNFVQPFLYSLFFEGTQVVPPVTTNFSDTGSAVYDPVTRELELDAHYSVTGTVLEVHLHGPGARGANGPAIATLSAFPAILTLTPQQEAMLLAGELYIDVHSSAFPTGELRAQIDNLGASALRRLEVSITGSGDGRITGSVGAATVIDCDPDCEELLALGDVVTLTATPLSGATFRGWSGGGCAGTGTCQLTMDAAKFVSARFDRSATAQTADLVVTQSVAPIPAIVGKDTTITMTVTNNGPAAANQVALDSQIPFNATHVWTSPGCVKDFDTVVCGVHTLAAGSSVTFRFVVRPKDANPLDLYTEVFADESDSNTANNIVFAAIPVNAAPAAIAVLRYRLYSDVTKEHHFTTDLNEYNVLGGNGNWVQEGTVGKVLNNPGSFNGVTAVPYYRLYDTSTQWHHWTTDANEYYTLTQFPHWNAEGVDGYILPTNTTGATQLYRLNYPYLGSLHHWTIDANEYNTLIGQYGWIGEGGAGFVIQ